MLARNGRRRGQLFDGNGRRNEAVEEKGQLFDGNGRRNEAVEGKGQLFDGNGRRNEAVEERGSCSTGIAEETKQSLEREWPKVKKQVPSGD